MAKIKYFIIKLMYKIIDLVTLSIYLSFPKYFMNNLALYNHTVERLMRIILKVMNFNMFAK